MLSLLVRSRTPPEPQHLLLAALLEAHRGRLNPISIAQIRQETAWTDRYVKKLVEELRRLHHAPIGAVRNDSMHGYYVIVDAADMAAAIRPYRRQILAMWATLSAFSPKTLLRELHGQMRVDDDV